MKLLLIFLLTYSLQAAGFWTLTGLEKANIYVQNDVAYMKVETLASIKSKMLASLKADGIITGEQDSATLMISLSEISNDDDHYVYIELALGEEVQTFRSDKSATYAKTYTGFDFIETDTDELDNDILESVDFLLDQFSEHYEDDKE